MSYTPDLRPAQPEVPYVGHSVDSRICPNWVDIDGKHLRTSKDKEEKAEYAEWLSRRCQHPKDRKFVTERTDTLGRKFFRGVCIDCGYTPMKSIKHEKARKMPQSPISFQEIEEISYSYVSARQSELNEIGKRSALRAHDEFHRDYAQYLDSERWDNIRMRVLDRARNTCEGCLENQAHDVHHITYDHLYDEFCFELRALCRDCHERIHGPQEK